MLDVIKSYLVALGFQVNQAEFNKAQNAVNELGRTVQSATTGMTKNYAVAATGVVAALAAINGATAGLITQVAKADLEYKKFALRLWTTKETAKELKTTLDAMGESMEDVAWIPELRQQYFELIRQGRQMRTPGDAGNQLQHVRSIMFEFKRLKLEVQYASEWISYYLMKYLGGPLEKIKRQMSEFNDKLTATMPEWTNKIAQVLATFMNVGMAAVRFIRDLYTGVSRFFDMIPRGAKIALAAILGVWAVLKLHPIGQIMMAITAALVLIEDFYGYIDGRKSSRTLAPAWRQLIDWYEKIKPLAIEVAKRITGVWEKLTGNIQAGVARVQRFWKAIQESGLAQSALKVLTSLWEGLKEIVASLIDMAASLYDGFWDLFDYLLSDGAVQAGIDLFSALLGTVSSLVLGFIEVSKNVRQFWKDAAGTHAARTMWDWLKETVSFTLKTVSLLGKAFLGLFDMIGLGLQGKFAEAADRGRKIFSDFQQDIENMGKGGSFESLVDAIGGQESGGDYEAVNNRTGARGKYQVLPENWPAWSQEAGLPSGSPMTPENQEFVARFKLRQYYDKYGARGAAVAWYAGEGALNYSDGALNRRQGHGDEPSINEYADSILGRMAAVRSTSTAAMPAVSPFVDAMNAARANTAALHTSAGYAGVNNMYVTVGDIYITQPNATPAQIQQSVAGGVLQAQGRGVARQFRELKGIVV